MEAANVVLVPGIAVFLARPERPVDIALIGVTAIAVAGFLIVGALYWHGLDRRLKGGGLRATRRALAFAHRAEKPFLAFTALATLAALAGVILYGATPSVIAAAVLALLAWLEYVNYYHRQLQHFDNLRDLKRLLTGRGMRRSHMARGLAEFRRG